METDKKERQYTNGEITIVWKPGLCTHIAYCFTELPQVFDPGDRPWIKPHGADTDTIIKQVKRCPTGALTYFYNNKMNQTMEEQNKTNEQEPLRVEIIPGGPALIKGKGVLTDKDGKEKLFEEPIAICRCGKSKSKPYCDGSHFAHPFE